MTMTRYRLAALKDTRFNALLGVDCELPLNIPIKFVRTKNGRLGFKRVNKRP